MIVLEVLLVAAVLFVTVAVAAGRGGGMSEAPRDGAGTGLPDGPFGAAEVSTLRLSVARRGYRVGEVDDVLDRVEAELARRDELIRQLRRRREQPAVERYGRPDGEPDGEPEPHPRDELRDGLR